MRFLALMLLCSGVQAATSSAFLSTGGTLVLREPAGVIVGSNVYVLCAHESGGASFSLRSATEVERGSRSEPGYNFGAATLVAKYVRGVTPGAVRVTYNARGWLQCVMTDEVGPARNTYGEIRNAALPAADDAGRFR